jgi:hypothetical protein
VPSLLPQLIAVSSVVFIASMLLILSAEIGRRIAQRGTDGNSLHKVSPRLAESHPESSIAGHVPVGANLGGAPAVRSLELTMPSVPQRLSRFLAIMTR